MNANRRTEIFNPLVLNPVTR